MGFYHLMEQQFGTKAKKLFKYYNNTIDVITRTQNSKNFLLLCRKDKIIPKFIANGTKNIFNTDESNHKTQHFIDGINKRILNFHVSNCFAKIAQKQKQIQHIRQALKQIIPHWILNDFIYRQKRSQVIAKEIYANKTFNKFAKLKELNTHKLEYDRGWFVNLTEKDVPADVQAILAMGPKFSVKHCRTDFPTFEVISDVECLAKNIENAENRPSFSGRAATALSNHIHNVEATTNAEEKHIQNCYKKTKQFLQQNKDLIVVDADKGNTTILMNRAEYTNTVEGIFKDTNKYTQIYEEPTKALQIENNKIVCTLYKSKFINRNHKRTLTTYKAQAPRPYAVIKLHKQNHPPRIIISSINSPAYHLTKFLNDILQKLDPIDNSNFNITNSFQLKSQLDQLTLTEDDIMASLDVVAMYERIPVNLVFNAIRKRWDNIENITPIPQNLFMRIVRFCVKDNNYLQFNQKFYRAKNGLTIGDCASPVLSDMVMTDILLLAVAELGYDPKLLKKYVDDIIIICPKEELENTVTIFNSINKSIKFTVECEDEGQLVYMDMNLNRRPNGSISTMFYQKPTNKGRILNYKSNHPMIQKTSTAYGLIHRVFSLSSAEHLIQCKSTISELLTKNSYPIHLINRLIKKYTEKHTSSCDETNGQSLTNKYLACNYVKGFSETLKKLYKYYNPEVNLAFRATKTVKSIYPLKKDNIDKMQKSGLVYSIQCNNCPKKYVGQTDQKLSSRMKQHQNDYKNRNKRRNDTQISGAVQHCIQTGHSFNYNNPQIVQMAPKLGKRLTLEMLHIIKEGDNAVNLKTDTESLSATYRQIV